VMEKVLATRNFAIEVMVNKATPSCYQNFWLNEMLSQLSFNPKRDFPRERFSSVVLNCLTLVILMNLTCEDQSLVIGIQT